MAKGKRNTAKLQSQLKTYKIATAVLVVIVLFLVVVLVGQLGMNSSVAGAQEGDHPIVRRDANDPMAIGAVDAPVVLVEWTDMRCPFCAAFNNETLPTIIEEYVDTGQVRLEVHDVVFFGDESEDAAVAVRAAGEQDLYFDYLNTMYAAAPETGHADLPRERLIELAEETGVPDMEQFTADMDDPDLRAATAESSMVGRQLGVSGVPYFVVGDVSLSGAQPIEVFRQMLDEALETA